MCLTKKRNEFVLGFGSEYPTSSIEDKLPKGYPDALLARSLSTVDDDL